MSQVNLLPPEILAAQRTRRVAGLVLVGGAALLGLLLVFYVIQIGRLSGVETEITEQQRTNNAIQDEIDDLVRFEDLQIRAQEQQQLLDAAYANEMSLSQALMDLSRITPADSFLNSFGVTVAGGAEAQPQEGISFVGSVSISGQAVGMDTVAQWIQRLEEITGWVNPWVPSVGTADAARDWRDFSASVDLTVDALTERGRAGLEATDAAG